MEGRHESRAPSAVVVGLSLIFLIGLILVLGENGALGAPAGGAGSHIAIVR